MKNRRTALVGSRSMALLFICLSLMAAACQEAVVQQDEPVAPDEPGPVILLDVAYGEDSRQRMDVYLAGSPASSSANRMPVIFLHGGGWIGGDKSDYSDYPAWLAREGSTVLNMNYRLADLSGQNTITVADMLDDIAAVIAVLKENAAEWNCAADRVALMGISAGGHLALLYAADREDPAVSLCVSFCGPVDLTDSSFLDKTLWADVAMRDVTRALTGREWDADDSDVLAVYEQASPLFQVEKYQVPLILVHGAEDELVPVGQFRQFVEALEDAGNDARSVECPDSGHALEPATMLQATVDLVFPALSGTAPLQ